MTTLYELNLYAQGALTYTDNRPSDVKFSFPQARDIEKTILTQSFPAEVGIQIIEVLKPTEALCSYSIDVSAVPGATVTWSVIPSGCSVSVYNQVYTIDGIDSRTIWEQVRYPTINVPTSFFGSFFYYGTINYRNNNIPKTKSWQVGLYVPQSELDAAFSLNCAGSLVSGITKSMPMTTTMQTDTTGIQLVGVAGIYAQFTAGYYSPAATLPSIVSLVEQGTVTPGPLSPYLTATNPNNNTTNTVDHFATDIAVDSTYVLVGARSEDTVSYTDSGIAYVFNKSTGELVYTLNNPSPGTGVDYFGTSVAITDNYFVVGAPQEGNDAFADGTVYAFNKSDGLLANTINNTVTGSGQYFGMVVQTIDSANDKVAVTSAGEDAVYYNVDCDAGTIGAKITQLDLVNTTNTNQNQMDAHNGWFAAGAPDQRKVYVYEGSTLRHTLSVTDNATLSEGRFGSSVAISDNYVVVGAYNADSGAGRIWLFNKTTGAQIGGNGNATIGPIYGSYTSQYGRYMKMTDDYLFVSTNESVRTNVNGRVWVYDTATLSQLTKKIYPPASLGDEATPTSYYPFFGNVFAFDGTDKIIVGDKITEKGTKVYWFDIG